MAPLVIRLFINPINTIVIGTTNHSDIGVILPWNLKSQNIVIILPPWHFIPMKPPWNLQSQNIAVTGWAHRFAWKRSCASFFRCPLSPGGRWVWRQREVKPGQWSDFSGLTWFNHKERRCFIMIMGQEARYFQYVQGYVSPQLIWSLGLKSTIDPYLPPAAHALRMCSIQSKRSLDSLVTVTTTLMREAPLPPFWFFTAAGVFNHQSMVKLMVSKVQFKGPQNHSCC